MCLVPEGGITSTSRLTERKTISFVDWIYSRCQFGGGKSENELTFHPILCNRIALHLGRLVPYAHHPGGRPAAEEQG